MGAMCAVLRDLFYFRKHALAEAFEREAMQASQYLPVGFRDRAYHEATLLIFEAEA